jgi:hypothetical protein
MCWRAGFQFLANAIYFSLLHVVQTGFGGHQASYPMGIMGSFAGERRQGREAEHSAPYSAEVKNGRAIPQLPLRSSWRSAKLIKHRDNFYGHTEESLGFVKDVKWVLW